MTANLYYLAAYRRTEPVPTYPRTAVVGKRHHRPGFPYRLLHSPFARDLRTHGWALGLLLAAIVLWAVTA